MMFANLDQAFDNQFSDNVTKHSTNINNLKKNIIHHPEFEETFYNAQGDTTINKFNSDNIDKYYNENLHGTNLEDLNKYNSGHSEESIDRLSFVDSKPKIQLQVQPPQPQGVALKSLPRNQQHKHSCGYYTSKFIETIMQHDGMSITSSQDVNNYSKFDDIYDHVKQCAFCRSHINAKLKRFYKKNNTNTNDTTNDNSNNKIAIIKDNFRSTVKDFDIKEITIIILIGIVIIFVLDMFVKIGRKSV